MPVILTTEEERDIWMNAPVGEALQIVAGQTRDLGAACFMTEGDIAAFHQRFMTLKSMADEFCRHRRTYRKRFAFNLRHQVMVKRAQRLNVARVLQKSVNQVFRETL